MSRSVNMAIVVGNMTRDPEMRYTSSGTAVTTFGVATNRTWVSDGEKQEEVEFHNIVAWGKLAELCNQLLSKGRRVYIQGRLQTNSWEGQDGVKRNKTEIVADDMVILDDKFKDSGESGAERDYESAKGYGTAGTTSTKPGDATPEGGQATPEGGQDDEGAEESEKGEDKKSAKSSQKSDKSTENGGDEDLTEEDIPF